MYYSSGNYEAFARPRKPQGVESKTAWFVGSGLAALAGAAFLIRDGQMPGSRITILEQQLLPGGALDGIEEPDKGFVIFGLGGGISFYEGVQHIRHPQPLHDPTWNYAVLGAAAVFEGISFAIALRQFQRLAGGTPFWEFAHRSKDPTTYTVLAEDSAALVGLAIAAVGIALSHWLQMPALDGAASVLIGILLAGVAGLLAWQSRGLLIGEGILPETARALRDIALAQPGVRDVGRVLSMYVGPDDALVTMDLDFDVGTKTSDAALAMAEVERRVRERFPMIKRLFIESGSAAAPQRWFRPDAIRPLPEAMATPDRAVRAPAAPCEACPRLRTPS